MTRGAGDNKSEAELDTLPPCDTLEELVSYAISCMLGATRWTSPA